MKYHIKAHQLVPSRRDRGRAVSQPIGTIGPCAAAYLRGIGLPEDTIKNASAPEITTSLVAATVADTIFRETDIQQEPAALRAPDFYARVKEAVNHGMLTGIRAATPHIDLDATDQERETYALRQSIYLYAEVYIRIIRRAVADLVGKLYLQDMVDYILLSAVTSPGEWATGPRLTRWTLTYCCPRRGSPADWYDLVRSIYTMLQTGDAQGISAARQRLAGNLDT